jgi:hypothetical protein
LVDTVAVRFGIRFLTVSCGASGVRGMLELLKAVRESTNQDLMLSFLSFFEWMKASGLISFANMVELLDSCSLCA